MSEKRPTVSIRRLARIRRELELIALGMKVPNILEALKDEGYRISEPTFYRDLRYAHEASSPQDLLASIKLIKQELIRRQLANITLSQNENKRALAMKYIDKLLDKFLPQKIEEKVEGALKVSLDYGGISPKNPQEYLKNNKNAST